MNYSKHKGVDTVCDHLENNREDQVQSAIAEMENQVNEASLDVADAHLQSNNQHKGVDTVCDHLENNKEDQVQSAIAEMENQVSEDSLHIADAHLQSNNQHKGVDTVCDHLENNREDQNQVSEDSLHIADAHLQSNNQESTPSVFKEKPALRSRNHCRDQSPSGPDKKTEGAGAKQPAESYFAWGCRMFKEILENVNKVLKSCTQLVEAMTDLSKSVNSIVEKIKSFSSVAQFS